LAWSDTQWVVCSDLSFDGSMFGFSDTQAGDLAGQDVTVLDNLFGLVSSDGVQQTFVTMIGRAASDVVKVQAVTASGAVIGASLKDGFWLLYGPADGSAPGQAARPISQQKSYRTLIITRANGTKTRYQVPSGNIFDGCSMPDPSQCLPHDSDSPGTVVNVEVSAESGWVVNLQVTPGARSPSGNMTVSCEGGSSGTTATCVDVVTGQAVGSWVVPSPGASVGPTLYCTPQNGSVSCVPQDGEQTPH